MSTLTWLLLVTALHLAIVAVVSVVALRVRAYTRRQLLFQIVVALVVPVIGVVAVLVMASEAVAAPPKPDTSRFDRNYIGSGD